MTPRTGTREGRCRYCSAKIPTGATVCTGCETLASLEPEYLAFCTVSEDCQAAADGHVPECPVEIRLRAELGF
jgi:hypothetical protein